MLATNQEFPIRKPPALVDYKYFQLIPYSSPTPSRFHPKAIFKALKAQLTQNKPPLTQQSTPQAVSPSSEPHLYQTSFSPAINHLMDRYQGDFTQINQALTQAKLDFAKTPLTHELDEIETAVQTRMYQQFLSQQASIPIGDLDVAYRTDKQPTPITTPQLASQATSLHKYLEQTLGQPIDIAQSAQNPPPTESEPNLTINPIVATFAALLPQQNYGPPNNQLTPEEKNAAQYVYAKFIGSNPNAETELAAAVDHLNHFSIDHIRINLLAEHIKQLQQKPNYRAGANPVDAPHNKLAYLLPFKKVNLPHLSLQIPNYLRTHKRVLGVAAIGIVGLGIFTTLVQNNHQLSDPPPKPNPTRPDPEPNKNSFFQTWGIPSSSPLPQPTIPLTITNQIEQLTQNQTAIESHLDTFSRLNQQFSELDSEITRLSDSFASNHESLDDLSQRIDQLTADNQSLQADIANLQTQLKKTNSLRTLLSNLRLPSYSFNIPITMAAPSAPHPNELGPQFPSHPPISESVTSNYYTVKKGDTLWDIAHYYYGDSYQWHKIAKANQELIPNPRLISPGQQLLIP